MESAYKVHIRWKLDDSYSVHGFMEYDDARKFYDGAVKDALWYLDAYSVKLTAPDLSTLNYSKFKD